MPEHQAVSRGGNPEIHMSHTCPPVTQLQTPGAVRRAGVVRLAYGVNAPLVAALRHPWVESIVRLSAVEEALTALHPLLSLTQVRARVVRIVDETASTKTFVLQPNALWLGAQAGQFVQVQVEIAGRRVERAYSLSSRPGSRRMAITVKRQDHGLVSRHLHAHVKVGDVLTISQALGEFVLSTELPPKMLLLSAGSGITPVMAMLRDLQARRYRGDVVFLHVCHTPDDLIFARQLAAIAGEFAELSLVVHFSATEGRFSPEVLALEVPDLAQRSTWMCGPAGFMDAIAGCWRVQGLTAPLFSERFVGAPILPSTDPGTSVQVSCVGSGAVFTTHGTEPLLVQAERAGLSPKHGCRIGICRSCQCVKTSGTVENLQTGELSSTPNELIRLCVSMARSDVALAL
jgi:ferredoxin-NADP reductase